MGKLEGSKIYPLINDKHLAYCRFKDGIFMIWTHGEEALLEFFDIINQAHPSIKFDCKYSSTEINFLDVLIRIDPSGRLLASLYKKPTDRNAYLHFNSYHPARLIQNIPYGQFLRCKKICTTSQDVDKTMTELEDKLRPTWLSGLQHEEAKRPNQRLSTQLPPPGQRKIPGTTNPILYHL